MNAQDVGDLIQLVGLPVALLLVMIWLFIRGKIHTDSEFQEMKSQRDYYRTQGERLVSVQEQTTPIIKDAVVSTDKPTLKDMADLVDLARREGLLK